MRKKRMLGKVLVDPSLPTDRLSDTWWKWMEMDRARPIRPVRRPQPDPLARGANDNSRLAPLTDLTCPRVY